MFKFGYTTYELKLVLYMVKPLDAGYGESMGH